MINQLALVIHQETFTYIFGLSKTFALKSTSGKKYLSDS